MAEHERSALHLFGNRCALVFSRQSTKSANLQVHVDSDWAGDTGRHRTTGMTIRRGEHLVRHMSTMQACIGLSSAGSEHYTITREACSAMGTRSHQADLRLQTAIFPYSDSSAARAAMQRKGLGGQLRRDQTRHSSRRAQSWCEQLGQRWLDYSSAAIQELKYKRLTSWCRSGLDGYGQVTI